MPTSGTWPMKLATAPIFGLLFLIESTSAVRSKSPRCTRIFNSAPGDRRKERDLVARLDGRGGLDHFLVDCGPDQPLFREYRLPVAPAFHQIRAQGRDRPAPPPHSHFLDVLSHRLSHSSHTAH